MSDWVDEVTDLNETMKKTSACGLGHGSSTMVDRKPAQVLPRSGSRKHVKGTTEPARRGAKDVAAQPSNMPPPDGANASRNGTPIEQQRKAPLQLSMTLDGEKVSFAPRRDRFTRWRSVIGRISPPSVTTRGSSPSAPADCAWSRLRGCGTPWRRAPRRRSPGWRCGPERPASRCSARVAHGDGGVGEPPDNYGRRRPHARLRLAGDGRRCWTATTLGPARASRARQSGVQPQGRRQPLHPARLRSTASRATAACGCAPSRRATTPSAIA